MADKSKAYTPYTCKECKVYDDHTWWCGSAPEYHSDGRLAYYWRD